MKPQHTVSAFGGKVEIIGSDKESLREIAKHLEATAPVKATIPAKTTPTAGPNGRSPLEWLVINPEGKLLAILDSDSEAYFFTKNRGHAAGSISLKASFDYASAPTLLAERGRLKESNRRLREALEALLDCPALNEDFIEAETDKVINQARSALTL